MNPWIALIGYAGAGKDAVAALLVAHHGYVNVAFADPLRDAARALDPWLEVENARGRVTFERYTTLVDALSYEGAKKLPACRAFLQRLGTEVGRGVFGEDVWVELALRRADAARGPVVFTDCRFPNEAAAVRRRGGVVVRVRRPGVGPVNDHLSERFAATAPVDATLDNDGTLDDLAGHVSDLLENLSQKS